MSKTRLILLNGTSSAGKTSIVNSLHAKLTEPYLNIGLDKFLNILPERCFQQPQWNEIMGLSHTAGPLGHQLISGMHHSIAAMLKRGNSVIADHVMIERKWVEEAAELFSQFEAFWIGIRCPVEVIEQREKERKNRTLGSARLQFDVVHAWAEYDLEIDSSKSTPDESAETIIQFIETGAKPDAFKKIYRRIGR